MSVRSLLWGVRVVTCAIIVVSLAHRESLAQSPAYDLCVDVPAMLGGANYSPDAIVLRGGSTYTLVAALPAGTNVSALHRLTDGRWLFSPSQPTTLQSVNYEPRDIISYNGSTFSSYLRGSAIGLPAEARIDALFVDTTGNSVISLDSWSNVGGVDYGPSDLIRYSGSVTLYWSGSAAGVPEYANVVGAAVDSAGIMVISFDVPTNLAGVEYLPGQLVGWNGTSFSSYAVDGTWPTSVELRDFSFLISSCANTACVSTCWTDGTYSNVGTFAKHTLIAPPECEIGGGCTTQPCN